MPALPANPSRVSDGRIVWVTAGEGAGNGADALGKEVRFNDGGVSAPAEDPALDFFQSADAKVVPGGAAGQFGNFLGGVPEAMAEHVGSPGIELDDDFVVIFAFEDGEAVFEVFVGIERSEFLEFVANKDVATNASEGEGAKVGALEVEADKVPNVFVAGEVIGIEVPEPGQFFAGFAVFETQGAVPMKSASNGFEALEVRDFRSERAEGNERIEVVKGVAFFVVEQRGELLDGGLERFVERSALVMFAGFMADEQAERLGFGEGGNAGKIIHGLGIIIAMAVGVVFERGIPKFAHPFNIAFDSFLRDS